LASGLGTVVDGAGVIYTGTLIIGMWMSIEIVLLRSFFLFLPTATLQQIIFSFYYRFVIQACCFLKRVFFCVLIDDR
jgi:hypothetical protein